MSNMLILAPTPIAALAANRGTGVANLLNPSPKEVWTEPFANAVNVFDIDLGAQFPVDTIYFGSIVAPRADATWTIQGGAAAYDTLTLITNAPLRAIDAAGQFPSVSHALWNGASVAVRYLRLSIFQPGVGSTALSAGVLMVGKAFRPTFNQEWGAGRRVIDTGVANALPDGGFSVVEGARKGSYSWTLGDLSTAEVDALYQLQKDRGESRPVLVVEDPAATTGQLHRIHYGLFRGLRSFERRNPAQTRWELSMEEWI